MTREQGWNHNVHYHEVILRSIPSPCHRALDVGCGHGLLARKLAERCDEVVAIDIDRASLSIARSAGANQAHIDHIEADVMTHPFSEGSFDCITTVATLHHLPLADALIRLCGLLKPGGVLVVIGPYRLNTLADYVAAAAAVPASRALRILHGYTEVSAPLASPRTTLREIRTVSQYLLPGSVLKRRLLFRYSLIWRKP